jgi:hypothetical protein
MSELRTQSRLASFIEAVANTVIGFLISVTAQWFMFKLLGIRATGSQFIILSIAMTVLSVVRGYTLRRMWNAEWWKRFKRMHPDSVTVTLKSAENFDDSWVDELNKLQDVDPTYAKRWLNGDWITEEPAVFAQCNCGYCNHLRTK